MDTGKKWILKKESNNRHSSRDYLQLEKSFRERKTSGRLTVGSEIGFVEEGLLIFEGKKKWMNLFLKNGLAIFCQSFNTILSS